MHKVSPFIENQLPGFIREGHPNFVLFIKAYYQWLEQTDGILDRIGNLLSYADIDKTSDEFIEYFSKEYLPSFPNNLATDKRNLIKNIQDFYKQRGNESSYELFFRVVFDKVVEFYYPSTDILKVDDGTWQVDYVIRTIATSGDGFSFKERSIVGGASGATAVVESVIKYQIGTETVFDLYLAPTSIVGTFIPNETISLDGNALIVKVGVKRITATGGKEYAVGDPVRLISKDGRGFQAVVSQVNNGEIKGVKILDRGIDYSADDFLLFYPFDADSLTYIDGLVLFLDPSRDGVATVNSTNGGLDSIREVSDRGVLFSSPSSAKAKPILSRKDNKGNYLPNAVPAVSTSWVIGSGLTLTPVASGGVNNSNYTAISGAPTSWQKFLYNTNAGYLDSENSGFAQAGRSLRISGYFQKDTCRYVWFGEGNDTVVHGGNFDLQTGAMVSTQNVTSYSIVAQTNGWYLITIEYVLSADMNSSRIYVTPNSGSATTGYLQTVTDAGILNVGSISLSEVSWDSEIVKTGAGPELPGRNGNRVLWMFGGQTISTSTIEDYDINGDFTLITVPTFTRKKEARSSKLFGKSRADRDESLYPTIDIPDCKFHLDANYGVYVDAAGTASKVIDLTKRNNNAYQLNPTLATNNRPILTRADNRENRIPYCNNIEKWGITGVAVTQNAIANPLTGEVDADLVMELTTTFGHSVESPLAYCNAGDTVTCSVYVKYGGRDWIIIYRTGFYGGFSTRLCWFNPNTGTLGSTAGAAPTVNDVGNGWYQIVYTDTATAHGATTIRVDGAVANGSGANYTGDVTKGTYIWGAQARKSTSSSEYLPTDSAPQYAGVNGGRALWFDGADYLSIDNIVNDVLGTDHPFTVVIGMMPSNINASNQCIFSCGNSAAGNAYMRLEQTSRKLSWLIRDTAASANPFLESGTSQLTKEVPITISLSCAGTTAKLHCDGTLVSSGGFDVGSTNCDRFTLGMFRTSTNTLGWGGYLTHFFVFGRELTDTERSKIEDRIRKQISNYEPAVEPVVNLNPKSDTGIFVDSSYSKLTDKFSVSTKSAAEIPLDVSDIPGIQLWLDGRKKVNVLANSAVDRWGDLSPNGYDAVQATATSRPIITRSDNKENGLTGSGAMEGTEWNRAANPVTVTTGHTDPFGGTNARRVIAAAGNSAAGVYHTPAATSDRFRIPAGVQYRASIYIKKDNYRYVFVGEFSDSAWHGFNIDLDRLYMWDGSLTSQRKIEDVGNGWYRVTFVATKTSQSFVSLGVWFSDTGNYTSSIAVTGKAGTEAFYLYGAQVQVYEPWKDEAYLDVPGVDRQVAGINGNTGVYFDCDADYMSGVLPHTNLDLTGDFSLFAAVRSQADSGATSTLFSTYSNTAYGVIWALSANLNFIRTAGFSGSNYTATGPNIYRYGCDVISCVKSGTTVSLYRNGQLEATGTLQNATTSPIAYLIGALAAGSSLFSGVIGSLIAINRAVDSTELARLHNYLSWDWRNTLISTEDKETLSTAISPNEPKLLTVKKTGSTIEYFDNGTLVQIGTLDTPSSSIMDTKNELGVSDPTTVESWKYTPVPDNTLLWYKATNEVRSTTGRIDAIEENRDLITNPDLTENLFYPSEVTAIDSWSSIAGTASNVSFVSVIKSDWNDIVSGAVVFGDATATRQFSRTMTLPRLTPYVISAYVIMDSGLAPTTSDFNLYANGAAQTMTNAKIELVKGTLYRVSLEVAGDGVSSDYGIYKNASNSANGFKVNAFQIHRLGLPTAYVKTTTAVKNSDANGLIAAQNNLAKKPYLSQGNRVQTNLISSIQAFSAASWTKTNCTANSVSVSNPVDSTGISYELKEDSSTGDHYVKIANTADKPSVVSGYKYKFSVYAKANSLEWISIAVRDAFAITKQIWVNLKTGYAGTTSGSPEYSIDPVGNGWYKISFNDTAYKYGLAQFHVYGCLVDGATSYTGDNTKSLYIYNPAIEDVNDNKTNRGNLATYSSLPANAAWTKSNLSVVDNTRVSWDGKTRASEVTGSAGSAVHQMNIQTGLTLAKNSVVSIDYYLQYNNTRYLFLSGEDTNTTHSVIADLYNGALTNSSNLTSSSITPITDENRLAHSNDLTQGIWGTDSATKTSATRLTANAGNTQHDLYQAMSNMVAGTYTMTARLKYVNQQYIGIQFYSGSNIGIVIDVINGVILGNYGSTVNSSSIIADTGGYWLVSMTVTTAGSGTFYPGVFFNNTSTISGGVPSFNAAGTEAVDIGGVAVSKAPLKDAMIVTTSPVYAWYKVTINFATAVAATLQSRCSFVDIVGPTTTINLAGTEKFNFGGTVTRYADWESYPYDTTSLPAFPSVNGNQSIFNTPDTYLNHGNKNLPLSGDWILACSVKLLGGVDATTTYTILGNETYQTSGFMFRVNGSTLRPNFRTNQAGAATEFTSTEALTPNNTYTMTVVCKSGVAVLYINGIRSGSGSITAPVAISSTPDFCFGANMAGAQPFSGYINEVIIKSGTYQNEARKAIEDYLDAEWKYTQGNCSNVSVSEELPSNWKMGSQKSILLSNSTQFRKFSRYTTTNYGNQYSLDCYAYSDKPIQSNDISFIVNETLYAPTSIVAVDRYKSLYKISYVFTGTGQKTLYGICKGVSNSSYPIRVQSFNLRKVVSTTFEIGSATTTDSHVGQICGTALFNRSLGTNEQKIAEDYVRQKFLIAPKSELPYENETQRRTYTAAHFRKEKNGKMALHYANQPSNIKNIRGSFWIAAFFEPDFGSNYVGVISKEDGAEKVFVLEKESGGFARFRVSSNNTSYTGDIRAATFGNKFEDNEKYFLYAHHEDGVGLAIGVNDGTIDTTKYTAGVDHTNFSNIYVGGSNTGAKISKIIMGGGTLGQSERAELYNHGIGAFYENISSGLKSKIWSYWEMSETTDGSTKTDRLNSVSLVNKNFMTGVTDLTISPWSATNVTVTKRTIGYTTSNGTYANDVIVSPFGVNTGNSFFETATTAAHSVSIAAQDTLELSRLYKLFFYFKPVGRDIRLLVGPSDLVALDCYIDGTTGEVLSYTGSVPPRVAPVDGYDGWFYFEKSFTTSGHYLAKDVSVTLQTATGTNGTTVGDTSKGFYFDDFTIAPVSQSNPTVTAHVLASDTGGASQKYIQQTVSNCRTYTRYNFYVYAKARDFSSIVLELNGTCFNYTRKPSTVFNLVNGGTYVEGNQFGSTEASIVKVGDWYKCTISAISNADGTVIPRIYMHNGNSSTFTTPVSQSVLVSVPTDALTESEFDADNHLYQDTMLRDYTVSGSSLLDARDLFPNGVLQNLIVPSQATVAYPAAVNVTFTSANSYDWQERFTNVAVFGDNSLDRFLYTTYALSTSQYYTFSVFIRMNSGLAPVVDPGASGDFCLVFEGNPYAADTIEDLGGGLYRVSLTRPAATSALSNWGVLKTGTNTAQQFKAQGYSLRNAASSKEYVDTTDIKGFSPVMVDYTFNTENLVFPSEPSLTTDFTSYSNVTFADAYLDQWANKFSKAIVFGDNSANRDCYLKQFTVSGTSYKFSMYVRMDDGTAPSVGTTNGVSDFHVVCSGVAYASTTVENLGGGLYRVSVTVTGSGTWDTFGVRKVTTYTAKTFKVQGFQLSKASLSQTYVKTFDKPYYNKEEYFSNAYMDGSFLLENGSNTQHYVSTNAGYLAYGDKYRVSVLARKKERHLAIGLNGSISSNGRVDFDLQSGTVSQIVDSSGSILSATTEEVILDTRENWIPYSKNMLSLYALSTVTTPVGLSGATANTITCSNTSATHRLRIIPIATEFLPVAGRTYRVSIDLKYLNYRYFLLGAYGDSTEHAIVIDLLTKTILSGNSYSNATVQLLENQITRFSFEFTEITTPSSIEIGFGFSNSSGTTFPNIAMAGTETVQIEGIAFQEARATNEILTTKITAKKQNIWYRCSVDFLCNTKDQLCNVQFHSMAALGTLSYAGNSTSGLWLAKPTLKNLSTQKAYLSDRDSFKSYFDVGSFEADSSLTYDTVVQREGYYVNERGQLDTTKYLRDDYFYQEWSYVLFTEETLDFYKDHINKILHPSGTKMFGGFRFRGEIS